TSINDHHNLKMLFGVERITGDFMNFNAYRKNYVSTALDELFAGGDAEKDNNGSSSVEARMNYFGRLNYDFNNKYLAEFVWRYDGSYIFPESKRFGFFPGVSLGWVASEEGFWEGLKGTINHLKLRGSWGQTGNDRIEAYQYLASFGYLTGSSNIYVFNGNVESKLLQELRIPNPNVTWEVANQSNIGFEAQLLGGKLDFTADYFYNLRTNILWNRNASVPNSTGLTLPRENIGEVVNQGFEFLVSYGDRTSDFTYDLSLNLNFNGNEIKFWDETPGVPEYQQSTGRPMNAGLYYQAIGVFNDQADLDSYPHWDGARPGDIIFEDVNGDGEINGLDRVRMEKTDLPTHIGGLNVNLGYKDFYANLFFQWATGAVRYDYFDMQGEAGNYLKRDVEGRWTEDNPTAEKPRIWNRYFEYWRSNQNTYWLQSSDYLRLKNVEIGYNIPKSITHKLSMEDIRIYLTGTNLLTFTGIEDFDPETTSPTAYPLNKVYNLGVSLTF
ncbi:MAG: SusC/RagA family TonB-linked outer membrane protein, partial [Fermentimonas sp.]|nr:SusC/RagA family TonB-linked outer membrane protein [Fermentimonas sp.]